MICPACGGCRYETGMRECRHSGQMLGGAHLVLLRQRTAALARSRPPDICLGAEIPAIGGGR